MTPGPFPEWLDVDDEIRDPDVARPGLLRRVGWLMLPPAICVVTARAIQYAGVTGPLFRAWTASFAVTSALLGLVLFLFPPSAHVPRVAVDILRVVVALIIALAVTWAIAAVTIRLSGVGV